MNSTLQTPTLNLQAYFDRIGYTGQPKADFETLAAIHEAHSLAITFENLSVFLNQTIQIDLDSAFHKLVTSGRGGYCFETNTLLYHVLRQIGFQVDQFQARVWMGHVPEPSELKMIPPRGHKYLRVTLADGTTCLVDVGFGGPGLVSPIMIEMEREQVQPWGTFRILHYPKLGYLLQRLHDQTEPHHWFTLYSFDFIPCFDEDFQFANYYCSTFPGFIFTEQRVCTRPTPTGRLSLLDRNLKRIHQGGVTEETIPTLAAFRTVLQQEFALPFTDAEADRIGAPLFQE